MCVAENLAVCAAELDLRAPLSRLPWGSEGPSRFARLMSFEGTCLGWKPVAKRAFHMECAGDKHLGKAKVG